MKGHPFVKTNLQQNSQSTSSSAIILGNTESTEKIIQKNPLFNNKNDDVSSYAMDMDTEYDYLNNRRQYQKPIEIIYTNNGNNNNNNYNNGPINYVNSLKNDNKNEGILNNEEFTSIFQSPSKSSQSSISVLPLKSNDETNNYNKQQQKQPITYLTGPMVVRVRPDGTPVEEDQNKPLPYDDDREILQYGQLIKIPIKNSQQISTDNYYQNQQYRSFHNNFYQNNNERKGNNS